MSSQRGNEKRSRPQKHQNRSAFKNNLHDKTKKIQMINSLDVAGCCQRCKEIIDWKIKYKKYKPLTVPKKCTKCQEKRIKKAYYIICDSCCKELKLCGKCGQEKEIVKEPGMSISEEASQKSQMKQEIKFLSERQRRTFFRLHESGKQNEAAGVNASDDRDSASDNLQSDEEDGQTESADEDLQTEQTFERLNLDESPNKLDKKKVHFDSDNEKDIDTQDCNDQLRFSNEVNSDDLSSKEKI